MNKLIAIVLSGLLLTFVANCTPNSAVNTNALPVTGSIQSTTSFTADSTWIEIMINQFLYSREFNAKVILSKDVNMHILATGVDSNTSKLTYDTINLTARQASRFAQLVSDIFITHTDSIYKSKIESDIITSYTPPRITIIIHRPHISSVRDERYSIVFGRYSSGFDVTFTPAFENLYKLVCDDAYFRRVEC